MGWGKSTIHSHIKTLNKIFLPLSMLQTFSSSSRNHLTSFKYTSNGQPPDFEHFYFIGTFSLCSLQFNILFSFGDYRMLKHHWSIVSKLSVIHIINSRLKNHHLLNKATTNNITRLYLIISDDFS